MQGFARAAAVLWCAALTACSGGGAGVPPRLEGDPASANGSHHIRHIVIVVQENRSFDNLFSGFPGADGATTGRLRDGRIIPLAPISLTDPTDIEHDHKVFVNEYDGGKMDGFGNDPQGGKPGYTVPLAAVKRSETVPYWSLASGYALADRMFESVAGDSFPAHQFLIAAQAAGVIDSPNNVPWGCDAPAGTQTRILEQDGSEGPGPFPCFSYATLAGTLDAAGVSWNYYAPSVKNDLGGSLWSAFDAIAAVRHGNDWAKVISPQTAILSDVENGRLANVAWVMPSLRDSDHPGSRSASGPEWVASIVNAIGRSQYWNDTAIFVLWDDWGGWYDHVAPPQLGPGRLGFRVPLIAVSAYAKHGYVSHVQFELSSVVKYVETTFGVPSLGATDATAAPLDDCFDYTQPAQPYQPLAVKRAPGSFEREIPDGRPPDND